MEEYFDKKNILVSVLALLYCLSIMDLILRGFVLGDGAVNMPDYGVPFVNVILSALLFIFALKDKDRLLYIVCAGWLAYFVLSQLFNMPGIVVAILDTAAQGGASIHVFGIILRAISMACIILIGCLLVEYLNDGTIYDMAFNVLCAITLVALLGYAIISIYGMVLGSVNLIFAIMFALTNITMLFLFTHFAYDSAKTQLSKTKL